MNTIDPEIQVSTISVDDLPTGKDKIVSLPGAEDANRGELSFDQLRVIVRYVTTNFEPMTTWADAVNQLRAKYVVGAQKDFTIVTKIIEEGYRANASLEITDDQLNLIVVNLGALTGQTPHWDAGINAKVSGASKLIRDTMATKFMTVDNRGDLDRAMRLFEATFGRPQRITGVGEPIGSGVTVTPPPDGAF